MKIIMNLFVKRRVSPLDHLWFLDIRLAQVDFRRERPGLFYGCFGGDDQQGGCWIWGQFLFAHVLLVTINAQFLERERTYHLLNILPTL